jgi:flagellar hook assembly protein FlgD
VELGLPEPAPVRLRLFDLSGRQVREIDSGLLPAGYHEIVWDGRDENGAAAAGGVYFFQLQAGRFQEKGRIVVLR